MGARDTDRRLRTVFDDAFRFTALLKPDGEVLEIDRQALAFWQLSESDVKGKRIWDIGWRLMQDEQSQRLRAAVEAAARGRVVRREAAVWQQEERVRTTLSLSLRPLRDSKGEVVVIVADARNLTRRRQVENALQQALNACDLAEDGGRAHAALSHVEDAVLVTNADGRVEYANPAAVSLLELSADNIAGRSLSTLLAELGPEAEPLREHFLRFRKEPAAEPQEYVFKLQSASRVRTLRAVFAEVGAEDGHRDGFVLVLRVEAEETDPGLLGRDALTGLLNRGGLMVQLRRALVDDTGPEREHTLCYIDLDGFEQVNHELGSQVADEILRQVAAELRGHARHGDVVARLGGDEFVLLLRDCSLANARSVTDALLHGIHGLSPQLADSLPLSASAGLAALRGGAEPKSLLRAARLACLAAKEAGGNRLCVAEAEDAAVEGKAAESLERLFEGDRLQLFQQPMVGLDGAPESGHAEILLRIRDDDGGFRAPAEFLARAERDDAMGVIDRWVIQSVFTHCRQLQDAGGSPCFSINLSAASLADDELIAYIRAQREEHGIDPASVSFEISESLLLADMVHTRALMEKLRAAGFRITLDDCGSGGHSLNYLRDLPVDYIKIGGELVRTLVDDPVDNVMVEAINRIGHLTGKRTIGKWVENDAIAKRLRALQVDYAQGYGLAEPAMLEIRSQR